MRKRTSLSFFIVALLSLSDAFAVDLTGRISILGNAVWPQRDELAYSEDHNNATADQQSLRLMLEGFGNDLFSDSEWSLHAKLARQHRRHFSAVMHHSSELFRYRDLTHNWQDKENSNSATQIGYEVDRVFYKFNFNNANLLIGRQPIDWGSGRFWQPLNLFGAFAPTDLDTDYKPGIDALTWNAYPSAFSSLTLTYVLAPQDQDDIVGDEEINNSGAVYYRTKVGKKSELALLAGHVITNNAFGASFESEWAGMGWRIEGVLYDPEHGGDKSTVWIAGADYLFSDSTLLTVEWYHNSSGAGNEVDLAELATSVFTQSDPNLFLVYGLQAHMARGVLGLGLNRDITPLWKGSYSLLASSLDSRADRSISVLQQINLAYSISNEADLLLSFLSATGKNLNAENQPRSEFGHTPTSITLRLRWYF